jgi:hypothetical protein
MKRTREVPPRLAQLEPDRGVRQDDTPAGMALRQHRLDIVAPAIQQHGEAEHGYRRSDEHSEHETDHRRLLKASSMASASSRSPMLLRNTQATSHAAAPMQAGAPGGRQAGHLNV